MGLCRMCGRKGLLLSVSKSGLCKSCDSIVVIDIQQRARTIDDCMKSIDKSKNNKTRLARCNLLLGHAQALLEYEHKGIPTISPPPSHVVSEYTGIRLQIAQEENEETIRTQKLKVKEEEMAAANNAYLQGYEKAGVKEVEVHPAYDDNLCSVCKAVAGEYLIAKAPILPVEGCTNLQGCRCTYLPVLE